MEMKEENKMKISITENEKSILVRAGYITENQNLDRTAERHLNWVAEAKIKNPVPSIKLLKLLHVPEEWIETALRRGQEKTSTTLEKIFEEQTGSKLF